MSESLLQCLFPTCLATVFLLILTIIDKSFDRRMSGLFSLVIIAIILLIIFDTINYVLSKSPTPNFWRFFSAAMGYSLRPTVLYLLCIIILKRKTSKNFYYAIPLYLNYFLCFISIWTKWVFSYTDNNAFNRGVLGFVPFVTGFSYALFAIAIIVRMFKKNDSGEMPLIILLIMANMAAVLLEYFGNFRFLFNSSMALSLIFYYLFLHTVIFSKDALTNLFNRHKFYSDMAKLKSTEYVVISCDLNNLKRINDREGHAAGDAALLTVVNCIKSVLPSGYRFYRMGGDEFVIIALRSSLDSVKRVLDEARLRLAKTPYTMAFGYTYRLEGENYESTLARSDAMMYEEKNKLKAAENAEKLQNS